jgi:hypothetical protein
MADWRPVRDEFLRGANEYPDLFAHWESHGGTWTLLMSETGEPIGPEPERLFKHTTRLAVALMGQSFGQRPTWVIWLDLMRQESRGFRRILKPRSWTEFRRIAEAEGPVDVSGVPLGDDGKIGRVFKESAEFCDDLAARAFELEAVAPAPHSSTPQSSEKRKRGRPQTIPDERKAEAAKLKASGGTYKLVAVLLYDDKYPTVQQVKNVHSILRHFQATVEKNLHPTPKDSRKPSKNRG